LKLFAVFCWEYHVGSQDEEWVADTMLNTYFFEDMWNRISRYFSWKQH